MGYVQVPQTNIDHLYGTGTLANNYNSLIRHIYKFQINVFYLFFFGKMLWTAKGNVFPSLKFIFHIHPFKIICMAYFIFIQISWNILLIFYFYMNFMENFTNFFIFIRILWTILLIFYFYMNISFVKYLQFTATFNLCFEYYFAIFRFVEACKFAFAKRTEMGDWTFQPIR